MAKPKSSRSAKSPLLLNPVDREVAHDLRRKLILCSRIGIAYGWPNVAAKIYQAEYELEMLMKNKK